MTDVVRDPYTFSVEDARLVVRVEGAVAGTADISTAHEVDGRFNLVVPALLMNANFSSDEWAALCGTAPVAEVVDEPAPKRRGRRPSTTA